MTFNKVEDKWSLIACLIIFQIMIWFDFFVYMCVCMFSVQLTVQNSERFQCTVTDKWETVISEKQEREEAPPLFSINMNKLHQLMIKHSWNRSETAMSERGLDINLQRPKKKKNHVAENGFDSCIAVIVVVKCRGSVVEEFGAQTIKALTNIWSTLASHWFLLHIFTVWI